MVEPSAKRRRTKMPIAGQWISPRFTYGSLEHDRFEQEGYFATPEFLTAEACAYLQCVPFDFVSAALLFLLLLCYSFTSSSSVVSLVLFVWPREQVAKIYASKGDHVHDEWVMELHQLLSVEENWVWQLASDPAVLNLVGRHLVGSNETICRAGERRSRGEIGQGRKRVREQLWAQWMQRKGEEATKVIQGSP